MTCIEFHQTHSFLFYFISPNSPYAQYPTKYKYLIHNNGESILERLGMKEIFDIQLHLLNK
jgi:hypothetical protein